MTQQHPYSTRIALQALSVFALAVLATLSAAAQTDSKTDSKTVTINWDKTVVTSKSTATLQVVVNPMTLQGSHIHDGAWTALRDLGAEYVRYVPWLPYPKWAVAELDAPTATKTSWDFTAIDPQTKDFLAATEGHTTVMNFSTIPAWLFKTDKPVAYPADPNQPIWDYSQGTELVDPSGKAVGDYFARLVSWYTKGGFTDENGKRHESGFHYKFPIWEVLNEPELEHATTPKQYTERYDAIVEAIHKVSPDTKFMGMALAVPSRNPDYFEYFLNPKNHKPGIPLDYISYHFYAIPSLAQSLNEWQYSFFDQADGFLNTVRFAEIVRKRLSPNTKVDLDELGVISADDLLQVDPKHVTKPIPAAYWNLAGAMYAYLYMELAKQQIDIIGESQLIGYPTQFPSVSMIDWTNGKPNARFQVLKLIKDTFHPGDKLVETTLSQLDGADLAAQAFETAQGKRLLLVNKRNNSVDVPLPTVSGTATALAVDEQSGEEPARTVAISDNKVTLAPFSVTVVKW